MKRIEVLEIGRDRVEIWQYRDNEFEARYVNHGISTFGTLMEVMWDLHETYRIFDR